VWTEKYTTGRENRQVRWRGKPTSKIDMRRMSINGTVYCDFSIVIRTWLISSSEPAGMEFLGWNSLCGRSKFLIRVTFCFLKKTMRIKSCSDIQQDFWRNAAFCKENNSRFLEFWPQYSPERSQISETLRLKGWRWRQHHMTMPCGCRRAHVPRICSSRAN